MKNTITIKEIRENLQVPQKEREEIACKNALAISELIRKREKEDERLSDYAEGFSDNVRLLSPSKMILKRFFRSKLSIVGLVLLVVLFLFSFLGPIFQIFAFVWPEEGIDRSRGEPIVTEKYFEYTVDGVTYEACDVMIDIPDINRLALPSWKHFFGTDSDAYDVFSRLMYGGRISLTIGFVVVLLQTGIGILLGGLAGYYGKWVDQIVMRIVDILNCVPTLPIMLIISTALSARENMGDVTRLYAMMAMLTLLGWSGTARLVRGQILSLREQEFMLAAEATGLSAARKIIKHLLPNIMPQLIVTMTLGLGSVILTEATLGFLGLGLPSNYATWGNMIHAASKPEYLSNNPNLWVPPGICIVLAVLAFNFVGDGLRDALDPKSRK